MSRTGSSFTDEFKREAVSLVCFPAALPTLRQCIDPAELRGKTALWKVYCQQRLNLPRRANGIQNATSSCYHELP
jgi:hypothetical protein